MFLIILTVIFALGNASSNDSESDPGLNLEACDVGDVVESECSKCICTGRHLFDCTSKGCPKSNNDSVEVQVNLNSRSCHPNKIYNLDGTICICNPDGSWPHKSCHSIFRSLPATNTIKQKCIPNSYVAIDCNVCRCNDNGQIDNQRCTKNDCGDTIKADHRRKSKGGEVYGKCKAKNWYSFAPCQFCYCLNHNKLMCNTGATNLNPVKMGSYNFSVCGTDLLKEAVELTTDGKEAGNVVSKDLNTPEAMNETTTKAVDKYDFNGIGLEMGIRNKNNVDKVEKKHLRIKTTSSQTENEESQEVSDSEDESNNTQKKITQQPYEDSANRERNTDNGGSRTDKDYESNSESGSDESTPIKLIAREPPLSIPVKSAEEDEYQGDISIKLDINNAKKEPNEETMPVKKLRKPSNKAKKEDERDKQTVEFDLGKAIKNNLPKMFSSVLSNLRKTVNLESGTDCEPGTSINVKCNVCHCLKNKKMICTNRKCE